jgi:hypothetical protein
LRLKAKIDPFSDLFVIPASINSPKLKSSGVIEFIVDTGSSKTTINDKDVRRLRIDYNILDASRVDFFGVGGTGVKSYEMADCKLLFTDADEKLYPEELDYVVVNEHTFRSEEEEKQMMAFNSLLGLDILKHYTISFSNFELFLEN